MLDQTLIKQQLIDWMKEFVETPNPALGNWAPCPYARAARINNKIEIKFTDVDKLSLSVQSSLVELDNKDVIIICFDHTKIDPNALQDWVEAYNLKLMKDNYVILEDHPDAPEYTNKVKMNFGHCGLLFMQKLDKLNSAADQLREKGYYDTWDAEQLNTVVTWRY